MSGSSARDRRRQTRRAPPTSNATPRSMRATAPSPQLRAMSVAFDDHGEIVPRRGTTSSVTSRAPASSAPPSGP